MAEQQEAWVITAIRDTNVQDPIKGFGSGKQISYRLQDGTIGSVKVFDADFNPATVEQMINDAAMATFQVKALTGPILPPSE